MLSWEMKHFLFGIAGWLVLCVLLYRTDRPQKTTGGHGHGLAAPLADLPQDPPAASFPAGS